MYALSFTSSDEYNRYLLTTSSWSVLSSTTPLHYEWIIPSALKNQSSSDPQPTTNDTYNNNEIIVFLHGLLGNIKNIKTMGTKICQLKQCYGLLIDLPGHGQSYVKNKNVLSNSNNDRTSSLLDETIHVIQQTIVGATKDKSFTKLTLVGHSLGGRLALQYTYQQLQPQPRHVWLLDTVPGKVDESVYTVLQSAAKVQNYYQQHPEQIPKKKNDLVQTFLNEPYNLSLMTAQWLVSSYNTPTKSFTFDITLGNRYVTEGIHEQDLVKCVHEILTTRSDPPYIHLIMGGKNTAWEQSDIQQQIASLKTLNNNYFTTHLLPNAGHWVHSDDLPGLLEAFNSIK